MKDEELLQAVIQKAEEQQVETLRAKLFIAKKALREVSQSAGGWATQIANDALLKIGGDE